MDYSTCTEPERFLGLRHSNNSLCAARCRRQPASSWTTSVVKIYRLAKDWLRQESRGNLGEGQWSDAHFMGWRHSDHNDHMQIFLNPVLLLSPLISRSLISNDHDVDG